jgi:hypothetical protein
VGGTGILAPAALALAKGGARVGVLARRPERRAVGYPIRADTGDPEVLGAALDRALAAHGPFTLALAYLPEAPARSVAALAARVSGELVHVLTSTWGAPGVGRAQREAFAPRGAGPTRWVLLGWTRAGDGTPRWHTPEEVSAAVLAAREEETRVGELEPWGDQPG